MKKLNQKTQWLDKNPILVSFQFVDNPSAVNRNYPLPSTHLCNTLVTNTRHTGVTGCTLEPGEIWRLANTPKCQIQDSNWQSSDCRANPLTFSHWAVDCPEFLGIKNIIRQDWSQDSRNAFGHLNSSINCYESLNLINLLLGTGLEPKHIH